MELQFFNQSQFTTICKVIEAVAMVDGHNAITQEQAALRLDSLLAKSGSAAVDSVSKMITGIETVAPMFFFMGFSFSKLSLEKRKKVIEKLIHNNGLLNAMYKDLARGLKVMSYVAYYSSKEAYQQVGYIPFEMRDRFTQSDITPSIHINNEGHV